MHDLPAITRTTSRRMVRECLCTQVRMSSRRLSRVYDDALRPMGLRSSQVPLLATLHSGDFASMSDLSRSLELDRTTLTRNLRPLIAEGFVRLTEGRGRSKQLELTREGLVALTKAVPLWLQAQNRVLSRFGVDRWRLFSAELQALVAMA